MPVVPAVGTISYNGYNFGPSTQTLGVEGKPVYDTAGRTVAYWVYSFRIKSYIGDGVNLADVPVANIRNQLLTPGGAFSYLAKGFGNLTVNTQNVRDVIWGPKPTMFSWKPIGGNLIAEIVWGCDVAVSEGCLTAATQIKFMEFNFKVAYDLDQAGFTRRTYTGYYRVPQTRNGIQNRTLAYTADELRENVSPQLPLGMRMISQNWTLSEDKCRCDYTVVHEEVNKPLPIGVVSCEASHTISTQQKALFKLTATISATYEMAKNYSSGLAWKYFWDLVNDRIAFTKNGLVLSENKNGEKQFFYPLHYSASEPDVFGRNKASFSFTYMHMASITNLMRATGLYQPVPNTDFNLWRTSLNLSANSPRGTLGMRFDRQDDAIVDLCVTNQNILVAGGNNILRTGAQEIALRTEIPPADQSFLSYDLEMLNEYYDGNVELKTLPAQPLDPGDSQDRNLLGFALGQNNAGFNGQILNQQGAEVPYTNPLQNAPLSEVQTRVPVTVAVTLQGAALRVGYTVSPPTLKTVGGVPVIPYSREDNFFKQKLVANNFALPLYGASWKLTYLLTDIPQVPAGAPPSADLGA